MKNNVPLQFNKEGSFTIAQFSDVEFLDDDHGFNALTAKMMREVIANERPDLIVFAGDVIGSLRCADPARSFRDAVAIAEEYRVPWSAVFGNHDTEGDFPRERLMDVQLAHDYCVALPPPQGVSGVSNYVLPIRDRKNKVRMALFFFDSGSYSPVPHVGGYDWVRRDQIDWYVAQSRYLTEANGGEPLPALAFFHIPLPEYREVWDFHICYGHKREAISSPNLNSGLFAAMVERGDVMGTFVGHDHGNDFCGTLHGIKLCYGRSSSYVVWNSVLKTGARLIRLKEGVRNFETWLRLSEGTVIREQKEHRPEGRAYGRADLG